MRANHVPRADRIRARISALRLRLDQSRRPMGGGNPYWCCTGCGRTDPKISVDGHGKTCRYKGLPAEIRYYESLLAAP